MAHNLETIQHILMTGQQKKLQEEEALAQLNFH